MTVYELNQAGYLSKPSLTNTEIVNKRKDVYEFMRTHEGKYFMLVCNEMKYYTLFDTGLPVEFGTLILEPMADTVLEIAAELGEIKEIEIEDEMIEFWIAKDNECHMYAFFNYDRGVVQL